MTKSKAGDVETVTVVSEIKMHAMRFKIVGTTPFLPHAMSAKAAGMLLLPPPKKNAAEKATTLKHDPYQEYFDAAYKFRDEDEMPTRMYIPGSMFHAAMANVAIDLVNTKKAQVARLTTVPQEKLPIWGVPEIFGFIVRSSDMNRTPDVRHLPILPRWATEVEIEFVSDLIKPQSIANLLANAGIICGIGDGRPGKGKKSFGKWRICDDDDPEWHEIVASGGRAAQDAALANPRCYDLETEQLLAWFTAELGRRAAAPAVTPKKRKATQEQPVPVPSSNGGEEQRRTR